MFRYTFQQLFIATTTFCLHFNNGNVIVTKFTIDMYPLRKLPPIFNSESIKKNDLRDVFQERGIAQIGAARLRL